MEDVAMDRVSVKFRVTERLPLAIIRVWRVKSGAEGGRPARAVGSGGRGNGAAAIEADERNRVRWQVKNFCFSYIQGKLRPCVRDTPSVR